MKISASVVTRLAAAFCLFGMLSSANGAPASSEDRYIAARDAAITTISKLYDDSKGDEATKAEETATSDLLVQMKAILAEPDREGFGSAKLNLGSFYNGDEDFGTLDGLRFDSLLGEKGEKAGANDAHGKYVEPRAHIVVTTQTLFERWLRAHKDWWGDKVKNVPQQMAKALSDESFYTQAISNGSAVVKFSPLPIATPTGASFAFAMLAGRTQSELPDSADEVIVAAIANGKVYVAEGSIEPKVKVAACRAGKKGEPMDEKVREKSEAAYARCFAQRAPQQPAFAQATKQAQALLASAIGK
ncbi:MAG: hypothetical protein K2X57_22590 [Xanthobacteraceae bacterium]|nr:hypothetical protein [Xanthobacteraceae bacterium]